MPHHHVSEQELEEMQRRLRLAAGGPWVAEPSGERWSEEDGGRGYLVHTGEQAHCRMDWPDWAHPNRRRRNAEFIALARNLMPRLLDELDHMRAVEKNLGREVDRLKSQIATLRNKDKSKAEV